MRILVFLIDLLKKQKIGDDVLVKFVNCLIVAGVCYILARLSKKITDKIFSIKRVAAIKGGGKVKTLKTVTNSTLKLCIYFIGLLTVLNILGVSPASLAAVSGSIAVAIGLGAQNFVSDIIAGLFIIIEEQFNVGDIVTINGCTGTVEKVTMRTTQLRHVDGTVYIVPNGTISVVTNKCRDFMNAMVDVGVDYDEDVDRVIEVMNDEMDKAEGNIKGLLERPAVLGITALDDSAVTFRVVAKCEVKENFPVEREIRRRLKKRFDEEGISIPFPQRTVHIVKSKEE